MPDNVNADAPTPLVPAWVNTDGSVASGTVIAYVASSDAFVLTGDQTAFSSRFGAVQAVVSVRVVVMFCAIVLTWKWCRRSRSFRTRLKPEGGCTCSTEESHPIHSKASLNRYIRILPQRSIVPHL